ncbi:MAG: hypothetical protein AVDCRST_MAG08-4033, partial [uncultured Acetobacteraceae bacterium]
MKRAGLAAAVRRLRGAPSPRRRAFPRLFLFSDPVRLPDPRGAALHLPRGAAVVARGIAPAPLAALAALA